MSDEIDFRVLRVGIEVQSETRWYEGLDIKVRGEKATTSTQNTFTVDITNLSKETRNYLLTETSPFNTNKTPKKLYVSAGRQSTGVSQLFVGEITKSSPTQPPDIGLSLTAQTGAFAKGQLVSRSGAAKEKLSVIAKKVADDLEAQLVFEAEDKLISNYSFSGAKLRQLDALAGCGPIDAYLDNETVVVKPRSMPRRNRTKIINSTTGMIGVPEATERGVKVKVLHDLETQLGDELRLKSEINPSLNGAYVIYKLSYDLTSRQKPWYIDIEATRK